MIRRSVHWCLPLFLASGVSGWAAGVWIDSSQVALTSTGATVINARLRAASSGSDQLMANGGGSAATTGPTLGHNLGTVAAVSSREFAFTLEHRVGQGMIFRMVDTESSSADLAAGVRIGIFPVTARSAAADDERGDAGDAGRAAAIGVGGVQLAAAGGSGQRIAFSGTRWSRPG